MKWCKIWDNGYCSCLQNPSQNLPCRHVYHIEEHRGLQKNYIHICLIHVVQGLKEPNQVFMLLLVVLCVHWGKWSGHTEHCFTSVAVWIARTVGCATRDIHIFQAKKCPCILKKKKLGYGAMCLINVWWKHVSSRNKGDTFNICWSLHYTLNIHWNLLSL